MHFRDILIQLGMTVKGFLIRLIAILLLIAGLIIFPLPIPFGLILIIIGLTLLISSSSKVADMIKTFRKTHPDIDREIRHIKEKTPPIIKHPLEITEPDGDNAHHPEDNLQKIKNTECPPP